MDHNFLIYSSIDAHLGCFQVLTIVNSAAMNTEVHVSFSIMISSGYMPSSGTAASHGSFSPSFLRNPHTVLHSSIPFSIISIYYSFLIHGKKTIRISYNEDVSNNLKSTYYVIIILQRKNKRHL